MKFGLSDSEFKLLEDLFFNPIQKWGGSVWVFGSRARGDHHPFSDLDILFDAKLPAGWLRNTKEKLEESNLPFKVDIVELHSLAESYRTQVFKERVKIVSPETL